MNDLGFIHRFVPASDSDRSVVLLLLHGTGGNESDLLPLGQELLPGVAMLSPRGKVLEGRMPRFFRRFAEGQFDIEDVKVRAGELAQFVLDATRQYHLEGKSVFALGYSNGANIAAAVMLLHPEVFSGGVLLRAMVPLQPGRMPNLKGRSVLLCAGRRDPIVPGENTMQLREMLTAGGADVELYWHAGGHELSQGDLEAAKIWLSKRVLPE